MQENGQSFSDDEREQIGFAALHLANLGEDAVWNVVHARFQLMKLTLLWGRSSELQALFPKRENILHEVEVVGEVIRQARTIMQLEGKDDLSILDREAQAGGLGSIFDPESKIGKEMRDLHNR
jgi:hypothetical protein